MYLRDDEIFNEDLCAENQQYGEKLWTQFCLLPEKTRQRIFLKLLSEYSGQQIDILKQLYKEFSHEPREYL